MAYSFKLTVRDVLQRPHFKSATLISGQKGVYRVVNWVHIVEVKEIRHLLNGNELILTTGVGWGKTKASRLSFLKQLIERDCAGLCVELGLVFKDIPDDMRKLADEHDFPLIVFPDEVRFIDITQDLHTVIHEAKQQHLQEERWIRDWLEGQFGEEDVRRHLLTHHATEKATGVVACILAFGHEHLRDSTFARLSIVSRTAFSGQRFSLFPIGDDKRIVYILIDHGLEENWKQRIQKGIQSVKQSLRLPAPSVQFGIGKRVAQLSRLHKSFQTAQEALNIQQKAGEGEDVFYDDLHILRIVSGFKDTDRLYEFIMDYLRPVIEYDQKHGGEMMKTLKVFLACNGSKQETAAKLYIVRQTLYNRLEKLEEMLGSDFMLPEKRLAIEFAIAAYEYYRPPADS